MPYLKYYKCLPPHPGILDKHAPMKTKFLRGNHKPFVSFEQSRAIKIRSRLRNRFNKNKTDGNWEAYRKQRNKCVSLKRQAKITHFKSFTEEEEVASKSFWDLAGTHVGNKSNIKNDDYMLLENEEIIKDEHEIANMFNDHFVNVVERTCSHQKGYIRPKRQMDSIEDIITNYENHPSIKLIKGNIIKDTTFIMPPANEEDIEGIISKLKLKKSSGLDNIPTKIIKLSSHVIKKPLTNIINATIKTSKFIDDGKVGKVTPIYKNPKDGSRLNKNHHRPITLLIVFSKIIEKYYQNSMQDFVESLLSKYLSSYRKGYSCEHVLLRLTEEWREYLDQNKIVGAILMDLSKAFDCLPHELLIAKLEAYGFDITVLKLLYSYLKGRKQTVNINGIFSTFLDILAGVPQGSILGPILFNLFINDIFMTIREGNLHNFADDNTLSAVATQVSELVNTLESDTEGTINWLESNSMFANASKFHGIILNKQRTETKTYL